MEAARHGKTDVAQALLAAGANIEARNNDGWTALIGAARLGYVDIVQALLAAGAKPRFIDYMNKPLLIWARIISFFR